MIATWSRQCWRICLFLDVQENISRRENWFFFGAPRYIAPASMLRSRLSQGTAWKTLSIACGLPRGGLCRCGMVWNEARVSMPAPSGPAFARTPRWVAAGVTVAPDGDVDEPMTSAARGRRALCRMTGKRIVVGAPEVVQKRGLQPLSWPSCCRLSCCCKNLIGDLCRSGRRFAKIWVTAFTRQYVPVRPRNGIHMVMLVSERRGEGDKPRLRATVDGNGEGQPSRIRGGDVANE